MRWRRLSVRGMKVETRADLWRDNLTELTCKVFGHRKPPVRKFGGELLCGRCRAQVGRWSR